MLPKKPVSISLEFAEFVSKKLLGKDEELIVSLTLLKKEPERAREVVQGNLYELTVIAALELKEMIIIYNTELAAQEIIEYIQQTYAQQIASIK